MKKSLQQGGSIAFLIITASLIFWQLQQPVPLAVTVEKATIGLVEKTVSNTRAGTIKACRRARLSPASGGQIAELPVQEGQFVKQGDLLLSLWNDDLQAQIHLHEAEAKAAEASREALCLQADIAGREAQRLEKLQTSGAASREAIDKAATQARSSRASCQAGIAKVSTAIAQANVVRAQLQRTRLYAPFAGVIAQINGELSEYATPSPPGIPTPPVIDLIDNRCFLVSAPVDEVDAPQVQPGQTARITLDAWRERHFEGKVQRIADFVEDREKQARTVEVELTFINPEDLTHLLAGYSANVDILLQSNAQTLRIPTSALLDDGHVYLFQPSTDSIHRRAVTTGMSNWSYTEIIKGLNEGDSVITSLEINGLDDGAKVVIKHPEP